MLLYPAFFSTIAAHVPYSYVSSKNKENRVTCKSNSITCQWPTHSANDKNFNSKNYEEPAQKPQCNVDKLKAIVNRFGKEPDGDKSYSNRISCSGNMYILVNR